MSRKKKLLYFAIEVWGRVLKDKVGAYAAQSSFFILLSAIPFVILLLQLMKFLPFTQDDMMYIVYTVFPDYIVPVVQSILDELYSNSLGLVAATFIAAMWSSAKAAHGISYGLDAICTSNEQRNWFVLRFWSILHTAIIAIGLIIVLATTVFWKIIRSYLYEFVGENFENFPIYIVNFWAKWLILLTSLTFLFALMFTVFPARRMSFVRQIPGALFTSVGWFIFSNILTIYVDDFNGFSMYGSLTTIALALFWLYICIYMIFIGAEINEAMRLKREDTGLKL